MNKIKELNLHDRICISIAGMEMKIFVMRVPGGLLYDYSKSYESIHTQFIPFIDFKNE